METVYQRDFCDNLAAKTSQLRINSYKAKVKLRRERRRAEEVGHHLFSSDEDSDYEFEPRPSPKYNEHWPHPRTLTPRSYAVYREQRRAREMSHTNIFVNGGGWNEPVSQTKPTRDVRFATSEDEGFSSPLVPRAAKVPQKGVPKLELAGRLTPSPLPTRTRLHQATQTTFKGVDKGVQTTTTTISTTPWRTGQRKQAPSRGQRESRPSLLLASREGPESGLRPFAAYGSGVRDGGIGVNRRSFNAMATQPRAERPRAPEMSYAEVRVPRGRLAGRFARDYFAAAPIPRPLPPSEYRRQFRTLRFT